MKNIVIIKIGASKLFAGDHVLEQLPQDVLNTIQSYSKSHSVIIVASGAINFGKSLTQSAEISLSALSSIGQIPLIQHYSKLLSNLNLRTAQCLITQANLKLPSFLANIKNVLFELLECDYIPILNANDTVSVAELPFGDNHALTAELIPLIGATETVVFHKSENTEKLTAYNHLQNFCKFTYKAF